MKSETAAHFAALKREHILEAISRIDRGAHTSFSDSTKYDLVYRQKRYAPKAVGGLALTVMTGGTTFGPKDFTGGVDGTCFRALERCGFDLVKKRDLPASAGLRSVVLEILDLQRKFSSANTPEMKRRGLLIREAMPDLIRDRVEHLRPIFTQAGFEFAVEGRDGTGLKGESPWVRIFDPTASDSATRGWYVVLHFSRDGLHFYATLGCGATTFRDGSLIDTPPEELAARTRWARETLATRVDISDYSDVVDLRGSNLSQQFERAMALARRYVAGSFDEEPFWTDVEHLCRCLIIVYEAERLGKAPDARTPEEIELALALQDRTRAGRGQGRGLTAPERRAVELCAMEAAERALVARGYTSVKDTSASKPYDFEATKAGAVWYVEVKGTTCAAGDVILLTAGELSLHRKHKGQTLLIIVSDIELLTVDGKPNTEGGTIEILEPWDPDSWVFEPTAYRATRL